MKKACWPAGELRIEHRYSVLETAVLPLNYSPVKVPPWSACPQEGTSAWWALSCWQRDSNPHLHALQETCKRLSCRWAMPACERDGGKNKRSGSPFMMLLHAKTVTLYRIVEDRRVYIIGCSPLFQIKWVVGSIYLRRLLCSSHRMVHTEVPATVILMIFGVRVDVLWLFIAVRKRRHRSDEIMARIEDIHHRLTMLIKT